MSDLTKFEEDLLAKSAIFEDVVDGRQPLSKLREILTDDGDWTTQRQVNWLQFAVQNRVFKWIRLIERTTLPRHNPALPSQDQKLDHLSSTETPRVTNDEPLREKPKDGGNPDVV